VPDPQLHLHHLLIGLIGALDGAGRLRALDSLVLANYQPELEAEVMARRRPVDAEVAYAERQARRQGLPEPWRAEEGAIPRAIVVAEEPWASPALARTLSVAAASHLVAPPPVASVARRVDERERQLREQQEQAARRAAEQTEQARRAARRCQAQREGAERGPGGRASARSRPPSR
jgi:hypothetical protein